MNLAPETEVIKMQLQEVVQTGGGGAVNSVNGQTGDVVLGASDVGALPDNTPLFSGSYNDLTDKPTIPAIDDTTPASNKVYSSEKVESLLDDKMDLNERNIVTRKLNITRDMELSNISSNGTLYLYDNENIAYIEDVAETTENGITYKVKDGLIYVSGTASTTFYISANVKVPDNWAGQAALGDIAVVSGTRTAGNVKLSLPVTYMSSGGTEAQWSLGIGGQNKMQIISVTEAASRIQVQSSLVCENLVLRPYFALRTEARNAAGWTNKPTAMRHTISESSLSGVAGILMTMGANFSAHIKNRKVMNGLFGKKMALCGDSIAYGHSGDSFGWTIAENENMALDKKAWGTARFANSSPVISIYEQVASLTKDYDYIIVEGGINDALNGVTLGTLTEAFDSVLDESTCLGAAEKVCKFLVENYPTAKKLFVLCHKCTNKNCVPYDVQETFFDGIITALRKWNIPYIDLREYPLCAYNSTIGNAYFGVFSSQGSLHPNNDGYAIGYIDQITAKLKEI